MMRKGVQGPLAQSGNTPPPDLIYEPPLDNGLQILHRDGYIIAVSKPADLLSVPGNKPHLQDCLEARVQKEFPAATTVHRLDRGTSGITVMALTVQAHRHLGLQFEKRRTSKTYIALVSGRVSEDSGTIDLPLRTDWYNRPKQMVDVCLGREALTHWRVAERFADHTRMALNPVTGRSHQLRVHMQAMGHPILGDEFYAPWQEVKNHPRLMLHAARLEISHPATGTRICLDDPCPF